MGSFFEHIAFYKNENIENWVAENRLPRFGPLNIDAMAELLDCDIIFEKLLSARGLLTKSKPHRLTIDIGQNWHEQLLTFAHEIGHLYIWEYVPWLDCSDSGHPYDRIRQEHFCDWFARELLLPKNWLGISPLPNIDLVCSELHLDEDTVLLQLMALGRAPALFRNQNGEVFCLDCANNSDIHKFKHWDGTQLRCSCMAYRENPKLPLSFFGIQLPLPLVF